MDLVFEKRYIQVAFKALRERIRGWIPLHGVREWDGAVRSMRQCDLA